MSAYIEELLHPIPIDIFFSEFWEKKGIFIAGEANKQKFWHFDWGELNESLRAGATKSRAVQKGKEYPIRTPANIMEQFALGRTIVSDSIESAHPRMRKIVADLSREMGAEVTINIYATPQGEQGFDLHHDSQDVFLLQTHGRKKWRVYENQEHPFPLEGGTYQEVIGRLKHKTSHGAEPYLECTLEPGDTLYIPRGHWHEGASMEASMHLTLTIVMVKGVDLITLLAKQLREAEFFRKNLPAILFFEGHDAPFVSGDLPMALMKLREELIKICTPEKFNALWCELTSLGYAANEIFLPAVTPIQKNDIQNIQFERNPSQRANITFEENGFVLFCAGRKIWFDQITLPVIQKIFSMTTFTVLDLHNHCANLDHSIIEEVLFSLQKDFLIREHN